MLIRIPLNERIKRTGKLKKYDLRNITTNGCSISPHPSIFLQDQYSHVSHAHH